MARVEYEEKPEERSNQPRQQNEEEGVGHTPNKAEGDERDMEEALRRKNEH